MLLWSFINTLSGLLRACSALCKNKRPFSIYTRNVKWVISCEMKAADLHKSTIIFTVWQTGASTKYVFDRYPLNQQSPLRQKSGVWFILQEAMIAVPLKYQSSCTKNAPLLYLASALGGTLMYTRICLLWPAQQVPCYTFSHLLITSVPQLVHSAAGVCLISHTSCTEVVVMALKMKSIVHDSPSSFHTIYSAVLFPLHIHFKWMCLEWNEKPPRGAYC